MIYLSKHIYVSPSYFPSGFDHQNLFWEKTNVIYIIERLFELVYKTYFGKKNMIYLSKHIRFTILLSLGGGGGGCHIASWA